MTPSSDQPPQIRPATLSPRSPLVSRPSPWKRWAAVLVLAVLGIYAGTPWLAPVFMRLGWERPAGWIYLAYSTQCHQLANRSYFLFGPRLMYTIDELEAAGAGEGMLELREFRGSADLGWKVAWSDRMVSMYSSAFVFLLVFHLAGRRRPPIPWWTFAVLLVPLALDGGTHFLSDLSGFGQGFRDDNAWLVRLTQGRLPPVFYAGDAWGSFNATARLVTGLLFGLGIAGLIAPHLPRSSVPAERASARLAAQGESPAAAVPGPSYNRVR